MWVKFQHENKERTTSVKNGKAVNMLCSCGGKHTTKQTAKPVYFNGEKLYCKECGRKWVVTDTQELKKERENKKALENLHIFPAWNDWESYGQFYMLSARVDLETWKTIKKYFHYFTRRELESSEMESFDFIEGWATRSPYEVEKILMEKGLIKEENSLDNILEKQRIAKEKREERRKAEKKQKEIETAKRKEKEDTLLGFFRDDGDVIALSDAEATHYIGRKGETVFQDRVSRFCVDGGYLVHARSMGDFFFARKVLLNDDISEYLKEIVE